MSALAKLAIVLVMVLVPSLAFAGGRVALILGNAGYRTLPALPNVAGDVAALRKTFEDIGFAVTSSIDLTQGGMVEALTDFSDQAKDADVAVFFYAGHGAQMGGVNYFLGVEAAPGSAEELRAQAVSLGAVLTAVAQAKAAVALIDTNRNNPFSDGKSIAKAPDPAATAEPKEFIVLYSTSAGGTAADGEQGGHSPFVAAVLKHVATPGADFEQLAKAIRNDVMAATNSRQLPSYNTTTVGPLVLAPK